MSTRTENQVREELRSARSADRIHSAYLFDGPVGTGKRAVADWLCRLLLCKSDGPDPCERCSSCLKSHLDPETGQPVHADWQRLAPDGQSFKIEQIRNLQRVLSLTAQERGRRVGLLLEADALTQSAANALLKTLEEPPPGTTLILVATTGDALPSTIRSRSLRFRFRAERPAAIAAALEQAGRPTETAWLAAQLGGGSLASTQNWVEENLEAAEQMLAVLREASGAPISRLLEAAEEFRGGGESVRTRTALFLDVYEALALREMRAASRDGSGAAADPQSSESSAEPGASASPGGDRTSSSAPARVTDRRPQSLEWWVSRAEQVARVRREWHRRNLNPQLAVEGLLFALRA